MFDPKQPDGTRKKVTVLECWVRLSIMIGPIILPPIMSKNDGAWILGVIWLAVLGPIFVTPIADEADWEVGTEIFRSVFTSINYLMLGFAVIALFIAFIKM